VKNQGEYYSPWKNSHTGSYLFVNLAQTNRKSCNVDNFLRKCRPEIVHVAPELSRKVPKSRNVQRSDLVEVCFLLTVGFRDLHFQIYVSPDNLPKSLNVQAPPL